SLLRLPNELIWEIAKFSTRASQAALTRTCKTINSIMRPVLYNLIDTEVLQVFVRSGDNQWEAPMVVLLDRILRINTRDPRLGYLALTAASKCAARFGHTHIIRMLLAAGANPGIAKGNGLNHTTSLIEATKSGHLGPIKALIQAGANVCGASHSVADLVRRNTPLDQPDQMGRTPLMFAVIQGRAAMVELLVGSGADMNYTTSTGETALMYACKWGWIGIAWILVSAGCDVDMRDHEGKTAL
ncbi:hypothetical protein ASPSYDRAFT_100507, partial [Aspergillus sydowii CBS 593.65]